jgi:hypothetical protein
MRRIAGAVLLVTCCLLAGGVDASEYMGDFCWRVTPLGTSVNSVLKMGLFKMVNNENNHYIMSGTLSVGSGVVPYRGFIEYIGGKYKGSLLNAGMNQGIVFNQNVGIELDSTWDGSYKGISRFYNTGTGQETPTIDQGSMVHINCP